MMSDGVRSFLLWSGLGFAFSPVAVNLSQSLIDDPEQRYVLLPLLLLGLLLLRPESGGARKSRPRVGTLLVVVGLIAELIGIPTNSWLIARMGLPMAMMGVALIVGRPRLGAIALAFGVVPIPNFLAYSTSPQVESLFARSAAQSFALAGIHLDAGGPLLQCAGRRLELLATDSGIVTAVLLMATGWYSGIRDDLDAGRCLVKALGAGLLVVVVQPVLVLGGVATLVFGIPEIGRFVLTHGASIVLGTAIPARTLLERRVGISRAGETQGVD